jgi:hypothetical protein
MGKVAARWFLSLALALILSNAAYSQTKSPPGKKLTVGVIYEALSATNAPIWLGHARDRPPRAPWFKRSSSYWPRTKPTLRAGPLTTAR